MDFIVLLLPLDDLQRPWAVVAEPSCVMHEFAPLELAADRRLFYHARLTPARPRMRRCTKLSRLPV